LLFDVELDVAPIRCGGMEWWTTDSQPADGPGPDVRRLWRFDVSDALSLTPVASLVPDEDPGVPREALEALTAHWHSGRVGDADYRRLIVLAEGQAAALDRLAQRREAAPADAPRVELNDDERFALLSLFEHVVRVLAPLLDKRAARDLLFAGLHELEQQMAVEAARARVELAEDLAALAQIIEPAAGGLPPPSRRSRRRP
jgi:hypothetical protein